jgi:hypothetical protein
MNEEPRKEEEQGYAADAGDRSLLENDLELQPPDTEREREVRSAIYRIWSLGHVR